MIADLPWILGAVLFVVWFAVFETMAFRRPNRFDTLSSFLETIGTRWPMSIYLAGFLTGGLAVHLYWHWCPALGVGVG